MKTTVALVAAFAALGLAGTAHAQGLRVTLDDVTFSDGAVATGFFDISGAFSINNFDIVTTDGTSPITLPNGDTKTALGTTYIPSTATASLGMGKIQFDESSFGGVGLLTLVVGGQTSPTTFSLAPGVLDANGNLASGSGEVADPLQVTTVTRTITGGDLVVSQIPTPTPEPATVAPFVLGGLALLGLARRAKVKQSA